MNRAELLRLLKEAKVNPEAFSLDGGSPSEAYVLSEDGYGVWSVYYSERGIRSSEKKYKTESDACEDLKQRILSDSSTRWRA